MRRVFLAVLAFALISFTLNTADAQRRGNRGGDNDAAAHGWEFSYEAGLDAARRSNRPMMLVFRCVP